jgi:ribose transport system ATP-binding protein
MVGHTRALLSIEGVSKAFPGVKALENVSLDVDAFEIHGVVGENGAGKSTLMAIVSGALAADSGSVAIDGEVLRANPEEARRLGVSIVRQEPSLMPDLSVAENLFLGVSETNRPRVRDMDLWARALLDTWGEQPLFEPSDRVASLSSHERVVVEIVKALAGEPRVLILDEPTEHLSQNDVDRLFDRVSKVAARGNAVVYISHRIREVQRIASRLTVLRDGKSQGTYAARAINEERIVELIVGGTIDRVFPAKAVGTATTEALGVSSLSGRGFSNVDLSVRIGEIFGLAGIEGNGQRDLLRAIAGLERSRGAIRIKGRVVTPVSSQGAAASGIRFLSGDRQHEGILGELSVRENFALRSLKLYAVAGWMDPTKETARARSAVAEFAIKTPDLETQIDSLSGGNQQKLVFASVLATDPAAILADEPTQGVDVGARAEIHRHLRAAANRGVAVLVLSADAAEVAGLSDRVAVFSRGQVVSVLAGAEVSESRITSAMLTSTSIRRYAGKSAHAIWKWASGDAAPLMILAAVISILGAYAAEANEFFLTGRNLVGVLSLLATLAVVSYGQQVLLLVGGIDLSVGPLMGLVVVVESFFLNSPSSVSQQILGWTLLPVVAASVGVVNWFLVDPLKLHPMVATLATFMAVQGVSLILRPVTGGIIGDSVMEAIQTTFGWVPVSFLLAVFLAICLEYALRRSRWGMSLRALGSRREAARVAGIAPRKVLLGAYVGCSLLTGIAAIPMIGQVGSGDPSAGVNYTLTSIAAAVVGGASLFGGRGSFIGALLGALLITELNAVTSFLDLSDAWQSYLLGGMIVAAVAFYSKCRQLAVSS